MLYRKLKTRDIDYRIDVKISLIAAKYVSLYCVQVAPAP